MDQQERTGAEVIANRWPYDGPHREEQVSEAASALYALVRYLNNATRPGRDTAAFGAAAYRVTSNVKAAVSGLDQLLDQLSDAFLAQGADPTAYDDRRDRPAADTARAAAGALQRARMSLGQFIAQLQDATVAAEHLGND